jgi:hypothetical protein
MEKDMRSSVSYAALVAVLVTAAGCATVDSGSQSSRYARLPTGVTLLDTESGRCAGTVQVREERNGRTSDSELVLRPGENATFAVDVGDGDEVEWSCVGEERSVSREIDCPDATSHVRITRRAEGADLALECYGRRGDSRTSRNDR